jgi:hypothetical protein
MTTLALSYDEIARRLSITIASARRLVHRRRWQKTRSNDGRALVQVPVEFLDSRPNDVPSDGPGGRPNGQHDSHRDSPDDSPNGVAEVLARLAVLQDELIATTRRLGAAEGELAVLRGNLATERERAERLAGEAAGAAGGGGDARGGEGIA